MKPAEQHTIKTIATILGWVEADLQSPMAPDAPMVSLNRYRLDFVIAELRKLAQDRD